MQHFGIRNNAHWSISSKAWTQAVKVDGTVIVLNSGNYELVCLHHRETKTLYVSDLIEPPNCSDPGYGKLHVGIYAAAVQYAIDRMGQPPPSQSPDNGGTSGDGPEEDQHRGRNSLLTLSTRMTDSSISIRSCEVVPVALVVDALNRGSGTDATFRHANSSVTMAALVSVSGRP